MRQTLIAISLLVSAQFVLADDACQKKWQAWQQQYQQQAITIDEFIDKWQALSGECRGTGYYELDQVRLLSSAGRFDKAAKLAREASLYPSLGDELKLKLLLAYLDNSYYLPGKLTELDNPSFWEEALKPYRDMVVVTHGNDLLFWRLTEMNYLAGNDQIAYDQAVLHLTQMPESRYHENEQRLLVLICAGLGKNGEAVYRFRELAAADDTVFERSELVLTAALAAARTGLDKEARNWLEKASGLDDALKKDPRYQKVTALLGDHQAK